MNTNIPATNHNKDSNPIFFKYHIKSMCSMPITATPTDVQMNNELIPITGVRVRKYKKK